MSSEVQNKNSQCLLFTGLFKNEGWIIIIILNLIQTILNRKSINKGFYFLKLLYSLFTICINRRFSPALFKCNQLTAVCQDFHKMHGLQDVKSGKCNLTVVWKIIKVWFNIGYVVWTFSFQKFCTFKSNVSIHVLHYVFAHQ